MIIDKIHAIINSNSCHNWIYWPYIPLNIRLEILNDYISIFGDKIRVQHVGTKKWHIIEWDKNSPIGLRPFKDALGNLYCFNGKASEYPRDCLAYLNFTPICQWWIGYKLSTEFTKQEQLKKKIYLERGE